MGEIRVKVRLTNTFDEMLANRGKLGKRKVRSYEADAVADQAGAGGYRVGDQEGGDGGAGVRADLAQAVGRHEPDRLVGTREGGDEGRDDLGRMMVDPPERGRCFNPHAGVRVISGEG